MSQIESTTSKERLVRGRNPANVIPPPEDHHPQPSTGSEMPAPWTLNDVIKHRLAIKKLSITQIQEAKLERQGALSAEVEAELQNKETCRKAVKTVAEDNLRHGVYQLKPDQSLDLDMYPYKSEQIRAKAKKRNLLHMKTQNQPPKPQEKRSLPTVNPIEEGSSKRPRIKSKAILPESSYLAYDGQYNVADQTARLPRTPKGDLISSLPQMNAGLAQSPYLGSFTATSAVKNSSPRPAQGALSIPRLASPTTQDGELDILLLGETMPISRQPQEVDYSPAPLPQPNIRVESRGRALDSNLRLPISELSASGRLPALFTPRSQQGSVSKVELSYNIKNIQRRENTQQRNEDGINRRLNPELQQARVDLQKQQETPENTAAPNNQAETLRLLSEKDRLIKELTDNLSKAKKDSRAAIQRNSDLTDEKRDILIKIKELEENSKAPRFKPPRDARVQELEQKVTQLQARLDQQKELHNNALEQERKRHITAAGLEEAATFSLKESQAELQKMKFELEKANTDLQEVRTENGKLRSEIQANHRQLSFALTTRRSDAQKDKQELDAEISELRKRAASKKQQRMAMELWERLT